MKIVSPMSNCDYYEPLVAAGADEFFCGVIPYSWLKTYNVLQPLNRREVLLDSCNICSVSSMKILGAMVRKYKIPVKITFNSMFYPAEQYPSIITLMKQLMDLGFNTFIIADPGLISYLRENGLDCKIHLSGEIGVINSLTVRFFNQFKIARYIFPGKTGADEIRSCIASSAGLKDLEYEAFILNDWCPYLGAYCNTIHCDEMPNSCHIPYYNERINRQSARYEDTYRIFKIKRQIEQNPQYSDKTVFYNLGKRRAKTYNFGEKGCGLCKVYDLMQSGVTHLKVVGRGHSLGNLENDVKNLKQVIETAKTAKNGADFAQTVKSKYFQNKCTDKCFYYE